jgi:FkbM family methyltransferase
MNKTLSIIKTIINEFLKASPKSFVNSVSTTLGFSSKLNIYALKNGVKLKFSPGTLDVMVIRECFISNLYTKFLNEKDLDIVLDLGCQKGYFTTGLLSSGVNIKKAICVDPLTDNLNVFKENINLNKNLYKKGIKILFEPSAIFTENGKKIFYITGNSVNHSLKNPSKYDKVTSKIEVKTITIKSLFQKYKLNKIDLVKLDIEGAEFDLFRSKDIGLLLNTRYLVMEIHPDKKCNPSEIINILESFGFKIKYPNPAYENLIFASRI